MDKLLAMKKPKAAFQLGQKACKTYPTEELKALFYACTAECAEVDCDKESAHKNYKILSKLPDGDGFYGGDGSSCSGNPEKEWTNKGTLEKRLARTNLNKNAAS